MTSVVFLNYYSPYCMQMIPVSCMLSENDLNDLIAVLNVELISLSDWLKSSKLSLDTHTTFLMVFHRARLKIENCNDLVIVNDSITRVNSAKYLGIILDVKFNLD